MHGGLAAHLEALQEQEHMPRICRCARPWVSAWPPQPRARDDYPDPENHPDSTPHPGTAAGS